LLRHREIETPEDLGRQSSRSLRSWTLFKH
jgi:hypothetical protein